MQSALRPYLLLTAILLCSVRLSATHNRAGEITYSHVAGFTYEFTITTYTNTNTAALSRNFLQIHWGDGTEDSIPRISDVPIPHIGQKNIYMAQHSFTGPGEYVIWMEDQNRNANVANIPSSVNQAFYLETKLVIIPGFVPNNSVQLLNPPIDHACAGNLFIHNPAAYDPDGDSLAYFLAPSLGNGGQQIPGYTFPNASLTVDSRTGDFIWDAPAYAGEFNVAIRIEEYRMGVLVGTVLRDLQIEVLPCTNTPPIIDPLPDTCVIAGTNLSFDVTATDIEGGPIFLEAHGAPFAVPNSPATFIPVSGSATITGTFSWNVICDHVQLNTFLAVFKAEDVGDVELTHTESMLITVIAPATTDLTALPDGNTIILNWTPNTCINATGYLIYRRSGASGFVPGYCETGVPEYTGHRLIATVNGSSTSSYVDSENLIHGNTYCYIIVAYFDDGAESIASDEVCTALIKDVPVITHVSVGNTGETNGRDTVMWSKPTELDTIIEWPGPYHYKVYRAEGITTAETYIVNTPTRPTLAVADTFIIDQGLNTLLKPYTYRVELYSGSQLVGSTRNASSIFLELEPNDNQIALSWQENVPWTNSTYEFFKLNHNNGLYELYTIGSLPYFTDVQLANGQEYCYKVKTIGAYSAPTIMTPIVNWSQEACAVPEDLTPPCAPTLTIAEACEEGINTLHWTNPNNYCADDVLSYQLLYSPVLSGELEEFELVPNPLDTTLQHENNGSVAGCYAVVAIDSVGNRSASSNKVCVDNCPLYELPNVFTPNNDGVNDVFQAMRFRHVERIYLEVFNRWGQVVYTAQDPNFRWDAQHMNGKGPVPPGTYYYVCSVDEQKLAGTNKVEFTGNITILYTKGSYTTE